MDLVEGDDPSSLMRLNQEKIKQHLSSQCLDDSFPFRMLKDEDMSLMVLASGNGQSTSPFISGNLISGRQDYEIDEQQAKLREALHAQRQSQKQSDGNNNNNKIGAESQEEVIRKIGDSEIEDNSNYISGHNHSQILCAPFREIDHRKDLFLHENQSSIIIEALSENMSYNPKREVPNSELQEKDNKSKMKPSTYAESRTINGNSKQIEQTTSLTKRSFKSIFFWNKVNQIKRRFVSKLIQKVPSARFKHLSPTQFSFINDVASEYGYYIYENHLILSQKRTFIKKLLYKLRNTKFINKISSFFGGQALLFSQESLFKLLWDIFMVCVIFYLIIIVPIQHVIQFDDNEPVAVVNVNIIPCILILEMIVHLNSAVYENGIVTTNRLRIFKIYFFNFLKDIIVFIAYLLSQLNRNGSGNVRYFDYIVLIQFADIPSKLNDIETKLQIGSTKSAWLKLIKLEFLVLLIAHVACSVFLLIGLEQGEENTNSSWITKYQFQNLEIGQKYIISFYYIIITMTTIGYGDITPATLYEKAFMIFVALLATNVFAYSFSQISEIVKNEESRKQRYNQTMNVINNEMNKRGLNLLLQNKVRKYHEHLQYENEQKQFNRLNIFDSLPPVLREEVMQDVNAAVVDRIYPLKKFSQECKRQISLVIKQKVFFPEETIFQENETNDCIYYVTQGCVISSIQVKTREGKTKSLPQMNIQTFQKMCVFGYEAFLLGKRSPYSARANGVAVISYLELKDLLKILKEFPLDYELFSFVKDEAVLSQKTADLKISCNSCLDTTHNLSLCPYVKCIANRLKQSKEDPEVNQREQFRRKIDQPTQSLGNLFEIQLQAKEITFEIDKENIIEELHSMIDEQNQEGAEGFNDVRGEPLVFQEQDSDNEEQQNQNEFIHKTDFHNRNLFLMIKNQSENGRKSQLKYSNSNSSKRLETPTNKDNQLFTIDEREEAAAMSIPQPPLLGNNLIYPLAKKETFEKNSEKNSEESSITSSIVQSIKIHFPSQNETTQDQKIIIPGYQEPCEEPTVEQAHSDHEIPNQNHDATSAGEQMTPVVVGVVNISEKKQAPHFPDSGDFMNHQENNNTFQRKNNSKAATKTSQRTVLRKYDFRQSKKSVDMGNDSIPLASTEQQEEGGFHSRFLEASAIPLKEGCELLDKVFHRRAQKARKTFLEERRVIEFQSKENQQRYVSRKQSSVEELLHAASYGSNNNNNFSKKTSFQMLSPSVPNIPQEVPYQQNQNINETNLYFPQSLVSPPMLDMNNSLNGELSTSINFTKITQNINRDNNNNPGNINSQIRQNQQIFSYVGGNSSGVSQQSAAIKSNRKIPSKDHLNLSSSPWRNQKYANDDQRKDKVAMPNEAHSQGYMHTTSLFGQKQKDSLLHAESQNGLGTFGNNNTLGSMQHSSPAEKNQRTLTSRQRSSSNCRMNTLAAGQGQVPGLMNNSAQVQHEESFSSEFQIRCKENLQDLDMLICRKNLRMEQEKGNISNFIMVIDNEMDIDAMKEWHFYYRKQNYLFVLYRIRKHQEETYLTNKTFRQAASVKANNLTKSVARKIRNNNNENNNYSSIIRSKNSSQNAIQISAHQLQLNSLKL